MKKLLTILLVLVSLAGFSQTQFLGGPNTTIEVRGKLVTDSQFTVTLRDTNWTPTNQGAITYWTANKTFYGFTTHWTPLSGFMWGTITGTLSNQTDLNNALNARQKVLLSAYGIKVLDSIHVAIDTAAFRKTDSVYRINDSTVGFKINGIAYSFLIRGVGGSCGGCISGSGNFSPLFNVTIVANALVFTAINQSPNVVFAGPPTGSPAAATFRSMVTGDLPSGIPNSNLANSNINFSIGSIGTIPGWGSSSVPLGSTAILNLPTANPTNSGILSTGDWSAFNAKPIDVNGQTGHVITKNADSIKKLPIDTTSNRNGYVFTFDSVNHKVYLAPGGTGGGTTYSIGAFDGNGAVVQGLSISGSSIFAQSASTSVPGMMNITTQTFTGNKTFNGQFNLTGLINKSFVSTDSVVTRDNVGKLWTEVFPVRTVTGNAPILVVNNSTTPVITADTTAGSTHLATQAFVSSHNPVNDRNCSTCDSIGVGFLLKAIELVPGVNVGIVDNSTIHKLSWTINTLRDSIKLLSYPNGTVSIMRTTIGGDTLYNSYLKDSLEIGFTKLGDSLIRAYLKTQGGFTAGTFRVPSVTLNQKGIITAISSLEGSITNYGNVVYSNNLYQTQPIIWHQQVSAATAAALNTNTYNNGTSGVGATITENTNAVLVVDGVTFVGTGGRVLVKDEANQTHNGIYIVTAPGSPSTPFILTRDPFASVSLNMSGGTGVYADAGSANAGKWFIQITSGAPTFGGTNLVYQALGSGGGGGGTVTGTGASTQVAYWNSSTSLTGNGTFTFASSKLTVDSLAAQAATFTIGTGAVDPNLNINTTAANYSGIRIKNSSASGSAASRLELLDGNGKGMHAYNLGINFSGAGSTSVIFSDAPGGFVLAADSVPIIFEVHSVGHGADFAGSILPGTNKEWNVSNETAQSDHKQKLYTTGLKVDSMIILDDFGSKFATIRAGDFHDNGYANGVGFSFEGRNVSGSSPILQLDSTGETYFYKYGTGRATDGYTQKVLYTKATNGDLQYGDIWDTKGGSRNGTQLVFWSTSVSVPTSIAGLTYDSAKAKLSVGTATGKGVLFVRDSITQADLGAGFAIHTVENFNGNPTYVEDVGYRFYTINSGSQADLALQISGNKDFKLPGYLNSRNDGSTTNAFYADASGNLKYGPVSASGGGNPFADNTALVKNNADNTKLLILSAASITTGTTRTWTFPDVNGTVARNDAAQTFAGTQTFSGDVHTAGFFFINTDQAGFEPNSASTRIFFYGGQSVATASFTFASLNNFSAAGTTKDFAAWQPSTAYTSGTNVFTDLHINPTFNNSGGTNTVRGIWFDPTNTSLTGTTVIAYENVSGDNKLNSTSGSTYLMGGTRHGYVAKTSTYAITTYDYVIDCTSGSFTVTLPTAVGITGQVFIIKNSGGGTITAATTSSQTIDGGAPGTVTLLRVMSDGANWKTI